jgi:hypothetical protein
MKYYRVDDGYNRCPVCGRLLRVKPRRIRWTAILDPEKYGVIVE